MRSLSTCALVIAALTSPSRAEIITFPPSLVVGHTYGTGGTIATSYVDISGYRFVVGGSGMIPTGTWGGLWIGQAFGVAQDMKIFRPDGKPFTIHAFKVQEHPTSWYGVEFFMLQGYNAGGTLVAASVFKTDGKSETPDSFDVLAQQPNFTGLGHLWIVEDTFYVLQSMELTLDATCFPDCDASGTLGIDDFICFQTQFALGDPGADCDASGTLGIDDFICFQTLFALGC